MSEKVSELLRSFITDEQILEVLILFENRKMEAARLLQYYMHNKWMITTLEAVNLIKKIEQEFNPEPK